MKNKNARGCSRNVESLVTRCTVGRLFVTVLIALCLSKLLLELCAIIYSIVNSRVCPLQLKDISSVNIARNQYQYNHQSYYDEQFLWSEQFGWLLLRPNQKYVHIDGLKQSKFVQNKLKIWPEQCQSDDSCDRIIDQLLYQPNDVQASSDFIKIVPPDFGYPEGRKVFVDHKCRVNTCSLTFNTDQADAIIFQNADVGFALKYNKNITNSRRLDQIWIAYLLESPVHTFDRHFERLTRSFYDLFNWTASYRHDSDIVTPYEKFLPYADTADDYYSQARFNKYNYSFIGEQTIELIRGKRKQVVWFSSNCFPNNDRYRYANELKKYINVDIFGRCGDKTCDKRNHSKCLEMVNEEYKFYLAFENSNCRDYITEKLFLNAFRRDDPQHLVIPIVMGGKSRDDYKRIAPSGSYIHVDDFRSPRELAEYLHQIDHNDTLFMSYFEWKSMGKFIDTKFLCRVCALLHSSRTTDIKIRHYSNIKEWWNSDTDGQSDACGDLNSK